MMIRIRSLRREKMFAREKHVLPGTSVIFQQHVVAAKHSPYEFGLGFGWIFYIRKRGMQRRRDRWAETEILKSWPATGYLSRMRRRRGKSGYATGLSVIQTY